ncbi:DUF5060 domain-containing protein [Galbibacter mesophilus]|uniref:DUF5060 domain-containing protein n=1 Tax=Galbibacter mesophilus TaxID=379069 RepID=UPI00191E2CFA|nr:DUF5060 domain-containing protein [Galbibacter mesophilus]MCM5664099.1 DUF4038 domain-containing protein [Galbibacter mesophilus]
MRINQISFLFTVLFCCIAFNELHAVASPKKWDVITLSFKAKKMVEAPLKEEVWVAFENENGNILKVPAFYNGGKEWLVRFNPSDTGKWKYKVEAKNVALKPARGTIDVSAGETNSHGAIMVSEKNKKKFVYEDGTPYNALAFEADWLFALDAENEKDIPKTKELVSHIKDYNFNQVVMNVYAFDAGWGEKDKVKPENNYAKPVVFPFGGTNEKPDHSKLNIEFFKRLDRVINHLNEQGIISHLMIYVWNKKVNWPKPFSEEDNMFYEYVVKRYQGFPNLIWDVSKEALDYGMDDMSYITERIERLRKLDAYNRLVTVHDYNYCKMHPDKVDFIAIQQWSPNLHALTLDKWTRYPDQPVMNIEHGGYEKTMHSIFDGQYTDPIVCLDRNYQCIFAGAYSTYYWQNTSWYNVITNPFSLPEEQQPNFRYYKYLAEFMEAQNFGELVPDQYSFTPYALTNETDTCLLYVTGGMTSVNGHMTDSVLNGHQVSVTWFNPLTGTYEEAETYSFEDKVWLHLEIPQELKNKNAVVIFKKL